MRRCLLLLVAAWLLGAWPVVAHESRPAFLQLTETTAGQYDVVWKRPQRGDLTLGLAVAWPPDCRDLAPPTAQVVGDALIEARLVACDEGTLVGRRIGIDGLAATLTDALVRIEFNDGRVQTDLVKPASPWVDVQGRQPVSAIAAAYFVMGVEHILLGIDHLLFVLGLVLIVSTIGLLVRTVTAFTIAHSITLAMASLGVVQLPSAPVEAVIALSIVFLAAELLRQRRGVTSLTARHPWVVAFSFGLLHGFGFAGALAEVGLPQTDIPLALLMFNVGVEAGQLVFVAVVLVVCLAGRRLTALPPHRVEAATAYAIGSLAMFWLIERVVAFG